MYLVPEAPQSRVALEYRLMAHRRVAQNRCEPSIPYKRPCKVEVQRAQNSARCAPGATDEPPRSPLTPGCPVLGEC
eukprot:3895063-Prymnesium_polylepis.1